MSVVKVAAFNNRGTKETPFGFIEFTDGMRIGYAPSADGPNKDGLFEPEQAYALRGVDLTTRHWAVATAWVRQHVTPTP